MAPGPRFRTVRSIHPADSRLQHISELSTRPEEKQRPPAPRSSPLFTAACLIVVAWGLGAAGSFLLPLLIATLLAFVMAPLHHVLHHRLRVPSGIAVAISALVLISPLGAIAFLLVKQGQGLVHDFPSLMGSAQAELDRLAQHDWVRRLGHPEALGLENLARRAASGIGQGLGLVVGGLAALASVGTQGVLVLVLSILMLSSRKHLRVSTERLLSRTQWLGAPGLLDDAVNLIQRFLIARLLIVVIVGALSIGILSVFGVSYSVFLGSFIGVMTMVPAVGFIISLVPVILVVTLTGHSVGGLVGILAALVAVNSLDNYFLTPKMVGNRLQLNALATLVGLLAGGMLWGMWGMLLSVPLLGVARIALSASPNLRPWGDLLTETRD